MHYIHHCCNPRRVGWTNCHFVLNTSWQLAAAVSNSSTVCKPTTSSQADKVPGQTSGNTITIHNPLGNAIPCHQGAPISELSRHMQHTTFLCTCCLLNNMTCARQQGYQQLCLRLHHTRQTHKATMHNGAQRCSIALTNISPALMLRQAVGHHGMACHKHTPPGGLRPGGSASQTSLACLMCNTTPYGMA